MVRHGRCTLAGGSGTRLREKNEYPPQSETDGNVNFLYSRYESTAVWATIALSNGKLASGRPWNAY